MRNVFIDCGANVGTGYERINSARNFTNYEVIMFEPIKSCYEELVKKYKHFTIYNKAVWIADEIKSFGVEAGQGHSSNLLGNNYNRHLNQHNPWDEVMVECIDLPNYIKTNFNTDNNIFLKLDIEGAEYNILDKFIELNMLNYIKTINVEFHDHMLFDKPKHDNEYYINYLKEKNVEIFI